jgi:hypothetical protein
LGDDRFGYVGAIAGEAVPHARRLAHYNYALRLTGCPAAIAAPPDGFGP